MAELERIAEEGCCLVGRRSLERISLRSLGKWKYWRQWITLAICSGFKIRSAYHDFPLLYIRRNLAHHIQDWIHIPVEEVGRRRNKVEAEEIVDTRRNLGIDLEVGYYIRSQDHQDQEAVDREEVHMNWGQEKSGVRREDVSTSLLEDLRLYSHRTWWEQIARY